MNYEIIGDSMPAVICFLENGETMVSESGAMSWMSPNMEMSTKTGGVGKAIGRTLAGETWFLNNYTCRGDDGMITFASGFPGSIIPVEISRNRNIIAQKTAFLACEKEVDISIHLKKKLSASIFGGEGFVMQRFSGHGTVFLEVFGGSAIYELRQDQKIIVSSGCLVMMDATCDMDIVAVPGIKNAMFGGEGLFNTVITGPGRVVLQTISMPKLGGLLSPYIYMQK